MSSVLWVLSAIQISRLQPQLQMVAAVVRRECATVVLLCGPSLRHLVLMKLLRGLELCTTTRLHLCITKSEPQTRVLLPCSTLAHWAAPRRRRLHLERDRWPSLTQHSTLGSHVPRLLFCLTASP